MKRKKVKMSSGKQPVSVWRITFVKRFLDSRGNVLHAFPPCEFLDDPKFNRVNYLTYFVFGVDYPSALKKLDFVSKDLWDVFSFERFNELDYNLIYEL